MNEKQLILTASLFASICGVLFLSFHAGWIIIRYPSYTYEITQQKALLQTKRTDITFYFYKNDTICTEKSQLLWTQDNAHNIQYLINSWLSFLDEEHLMKKKVTVTHVLLSPSGSDAYISFDRNPLDKEASTYAKWQWVEMLLKTITENNIHIDRVHFLTHHKPLQDAHLDFSSPWPALGYTNKN